MLLTTCGFAIKLNLQLKTERFLSGADFVSAPYFFALMQEIWIRSFRSTLIPL